MTAFASDVHNCITISIVLLCAFRNFQCELFLSASLSVIFVIVVNSDNLLS